jgi:hypothetical protein
MDEPRAGKSCIYCGAENDAARRECVVCHHYLISEEALAQATDQLLPVPDPPDVSGIELNYTVEQGFSYPDWKSVFEQVQQRACREQWWGIYHELAKAWLLQLKADLGGHYRAYESRSFLLLCAEGAAPSRTILRSAEQALAALKQHCGALLPREVYGKHLLLAFSDQEDYYAYISHYYPEGGHSLSAGVMLNPGYMHIAIPFTWVLSVQHVLTHELVHNCIAHLRVPTWLHEGLAQKLEHLAAGRRFSLDGERAAEHHAYWNEARVQEFWSGTAFYRPDETNKLCYSLAEILVELLCHDWEGFLEFVRLADYRDAGQDAALQVLGRCLGETIGSFLGPGNWRPQRKSIAEHYRRRAETTKTDGAGAKKN